MNEKKHDTIQVDIFIGAAPLLETRLVEGLLSFGRGRPNWRFSLRGADFRYTKSWLKRRRLDGVLALIDSTSIEKSLNAAGIPWVSLLPARPLQRPSVRVDDHAIGRLGADFFLGKGFLKCAFCGVGTPWSEARRAGFVERLEEAGRDCRDFDVPFENSGQWGLPADSERRLRRWLGDLDRGVAVMIAHDALANHFVDLCAREGVRVPQDIAVLGVGDHQLLCELSPTPISSVDAAVPTVAAKGAAMLEVMLAGDARPESVAIAPRGIVERRSTDVVVYGDDAVSKAVALIQERACDGLTVEDVVNALPVSRRTLSRRFADYVGHSPAAEIRRVRLRRAREMITNTMLSLTEIAAACGYSDLSHLDRTFREVLNTTPRDIRAAVR